MKTLAKVGIGCAAVAAVAQRRPRRRRRPKPGTAGRALHCADAEHEAQAERRSTRWSTRRPGSVPTRTRSAPSSSSASCSFGSASTGCCATPATRSPAFTGKHDHSLEELTRVPDMFQGMSERVGAEIDAFIEVGMPPDEYRWLERLVYRALARGSAPRRQLSDGGARRGPRGRDGRRARERRPGCAAASSAWPPRCAPASRSRRKAWIRRSTGCCWPASTRSSGTRWTTSPAR